MTLQRTIIIPLLILSMIIAIDCHVADSPHHPLPFNYEESIPPIECCDDNYDRLLGTLGGTGNYQLYCGEHANQTQCLAVDYSTEVSDPILEPDLESLEDCKHLCNMNPLCVAIEYGNEAGWGNSLMCILYIDTYYENPGTEWNAGKQYYKRNFQCNIEQQKCSIRGQFSLVYGEHGQTAPKSGIMVGVYTGIKTLEECMNMCKDTADCYGIQYTSFVRSCQLYQDAVGYETYDWEDDVDNIDDSRHWHYMRNLPQRIGEKQFPKKRQLKFVYKVKPGFPNDAQIAIRWIHEDIAGGTGIVSETLTDVNPYHSRPNERVSWFDFPAPADYTHGKVYIYVKDFKSRIKQLLPKTFEIRIVRPADVKKRTSIVIESFQVFHKRHCSAVQADDEMLLFQFSASSVKQWPTASRKNEANCFYYDEESKTNMFYLSSDLLEGCPGFSIQGALQSVMRIPPLWAST